MDSRHSQRGFLDPHKIDTWNEMGRRRNLEDFFSMFVPASSHRLLSWSQLWLWKGAGIRRHWGLPYEPPFYPRSPSLCRSVAALWTIPCPTFQNLVKFSGHPFYIAWLLKRVELDKTGLPNLERLGMFSDHEPLRDGSGYFWGFQSSHFEPALEAIARLRREIVLAFAIDHGYATSFYSIKYWLESQLCKGQGRGDSIFSRLSNVSTLVIYINGKCEDILHIIPSWLQLFPSLRHLVVNASSEWEGTDLFTAIGMLCPCLETMVVNWADINWHHSGNI